MAGATKLMTAGGGGVNITPSSSIAADVTVNVPSQNCTLGIQGPAFSAYQSSSTNVATSTNTKVIYATEDFDTANCYVGTGGDSKFTPNVAGYYYITAYCYIAAPIGVSTVQVSVYKNGSAYLSQAHSNAGVSYDNSGVSGLVYCNGTTDYLEVYTFQNSGVTVATAISQQSKFSGFLVRAA